MVANLCPHCGQPTSIPMLFSITTQRVFNYIWHNPNCASTEIQDAIWGITNNKALVAAHIKHIRRGLTGTMLSLVCVKAKYHILKKVRTHASV